MPFTLRWHLCALLKFVGDFDSPLKLCRVHQNCNQTGLTGPGHSRLCFPFFVVVVKVEDFKRTPNVCRNAKSVPTDKYITEKGNASAGNTEGGSIIVLLTSCLTGLESAV